ncbi:MAG: glycosyltransferase [Candidatus Omnitrophota bacterium]
MPAERNVKVLHVRSSGGRYGAENVILNLSRELEQAAFYNHIVCLNNAKNPHVELVNEARDAGVLATAVNCRGMFDLKAISRIRRILRDERIDVIHTHDYKAAVFGLIAAFGLKVRRVATNHGWTSVSWKLHAYQFIEGIFYNMFDQVVAVSDTVAKRISPFVFNRKKIVVIMNGIPPDPGKNRGAGDNGGSGAQRNIFTIGIVGRLSREKGHVYLLKALAKLMEKGKEKSGKGNVKLLIVGGGPLEEELKRFCGEMKLAFSDCRDLNRLSLPDDCCSAIFTGAQQDMSAVYGALDVLVMPSLEEGLPMTLLEAMEAGVPVVATPVGEIPKIIRDGETGFLVKVGDVDGLARILQRISEERWASGEEAENFETKSDAREANSGYFSLLASRYSPFAFRYSPFVTRITENARKLVEEKYSARMMAEKYLEIYKQRKAKGGEREAEVFI